MADGCENLNLQSKTHEGVPSDMSTFGAANTQDSRYLAPRQRRSQWNNPCSWLTFDFFSDSILTVFLVVFLLAFQDELLNVILEAYILGNGNRYLNNSISKYSREQSNQPSRAIPIVSQGSKGGESQTGSRPRFGKLILQFWLWRPLDNFFAVWFGVGLGIVCTHWLTGQAPHLSWLCKIVLVITYFLLISLLTAYIVIKIVRLSKCGIRVLSQKWPQRAKATAEVVDKCCICLDPYEEGMEVMELSCTHYFHVKCIDGWLKINRSCPICILRSRYIK